MYKKLVAIALSLACCLLLVSGCSGKTEAAAPAQEEAPALQVIGTQTDGALHFKVTNETGLDITSLAIKSVADAQYPASLIKSGSKFAKAEQAEVFFTPTTAGTSAAATASDTPAKAVKDMYDIQVTAADGTVIVIPQVVFEGLEEFSICYADGVGFITYNDPTTGSKVSTKEAALAMKTAAEAEAAAAAQAEADAAAAAQAEAEAAAQAEAEAAAAEEQNSSSSNASSSNSSSDYDYSGSNNSASSSGSGQSEEGCLSGAAPAQSEEGCLSGAARQ